MTLTNLVDRMKALSMKIKLLLAAAAGAVVTLAAGIALAATDPAFKLTQSLPKATFSATVRETLLACPTATEPQARVRTSATLDIAYVADPSRTYEITAKGGGWSSVSFDLELTPDGRLSKVNASSEGAGGAALGGLFKAVAGFVAPFVGAESAAKSPPVVCLEPVAKLVRDTQALRDQIADLEAKAAGAGDASPAAAGGKAQPDGGQGSGAATPKLAQLKDLLAKREALLTLTTALELDPETATPVRGKATSKAAMGWIAKPATPSAYEKWFNIKSFVADLDQAGWLGRMQAAGLKGATGFGLKVAANGPPLTLQPEADNVSAENQVAYVQAPPVTLSACPFDPTAVDCAGAIASGPAFLPQAAATKFITLRTSVFGSRTLTATFAPQGSPLTISYKTKSEIEQISNAISGATEAVGTLRKAETTQMQSELAETKAAIELFEAKKKLADLQAQD